MSVKKKKITKKVKKEIKRAVEGLPGLMIEHVKFKEIEPPEELQKLPAPTRYDEIETHPIKTLRYEDGGAIRQKKIWLWTGVTIFSAIIFLMWGWNIRAIFQDSFANTKTKQPGITDTAKTTWKETVEAVESNKPTDKPTTPTKNLDDLKNKVKDNLSGLLSTITNTTNTTITD